MIAADLAIVGAGPAGLAAAAEATARGLTVALLDDNPTPGGQFFRQPPAALRRAAPAMSDREHRRAATLFPALEHPRLTYLSGAVVWHAPEPGVLAFTRGAESGRVRASAILVAAGAVERAVPFPGWTLPGVLTAGGLQNLVKGQRILPGRRFLVAGNGPLLLVAAHSIVSAGGTIVEVVESASLAGLWRRVPRLLGAPDVLRRGIGYRATLLRAGVPVRSGQTIVEVRSRSAPGARGERDTVEVRSQSAPGARGERDTVEVRSRSAPGARGERDTVEVRSRSAPGARGERDTIDARGDTGVREAVVAPIDAAGRVDRGRARTLAVDTVVAGFGLTPSVELTRLLGCRHRWDPLRGGLVPERSPDLETTVPAVFAAGDGAGIGGAELALAEGQLAALLIALRLGRVHSREVDAEVMSLRTRRARLDRVRAALAEVWTPPASYLALLTPDTVVCRCEEVTSAEVARLVDDAGASLESVKAATRVTMGRCQGRNCLGTVREIAARARGVVPAELDAPRARPPARPVLLGDLLHEPLPPV